MDEKIIACQAFLNRLEKKEADFLSWGLVNIGFSDTEIEELAYEVLAESESTLSSRELIELMREERLLFTFNQGGGYQWRTRMAEAVRLFSNLKQLFPGKPWQTAPSLVSDFRFVNKPRVFPARYIEVSNVLTRLEYLNLSSEAQEVIRLMLKDDQGNSIKLSDFQLQAADNILSDLKNQKMRGTVISSGTGTGKTLAFYLPALTHIAGLVKPNEYWTKILAIYPRNELLKDQFGEVIAQVRKLDDFLINNGKRKMIVGIFFGLTPNYAGIKDYMKKEWKKIGRGYCCPYFVCPKCSENIVWRWEDFENQTERLVCINEKCDYCVNEDEIILTRKRMAITPPDILFTTTESLNRQMSDSEYGKIFGIGIHKTPQLVMLDEIHTYSGTHGAQVAHLIRRWRYASRAKPVFAGLSATLKDAREFLGQLIGLDLSKIAEIYPRENQVQEGLEYLLLLRGDPVSGNSLLSTTIQTAMLLGRVLDPRGSSNEGFYGSKVFIFTDDLDVTNRLYFDLSDAEGIRINRFIRRNPSPLAGLRSGAMPDNSQRFAQGQSWMLCEEIGHPYGLNSPLMTERTTSQDMGVDPACDLIVATASLEVGYDDAAVGGIIQHKAPRDMASFIQRKGRAGRPVKMRPWTVVVLSDYGRDRLIYQGYERLIDTQLDKMTLPVSNNYVLRMQAVLAFMDWLSQKMKQYNNVPLGSVWNDFSAPPDILYPNSKIKQQSVRIRQEIEARLIKKTIQNKVMQNEMKEYLRNALNIDEGQMLSVLWEHPRPIMSGLLPTIIRRLESQWAKHDDEQSKRAKDYYTRFAPIPEYIPANLFSDLNLPEVQIIFDNNNNNNNNNENNDRMPIIQALKTFAPGNVTKRFSISNSNPYWIALPDLDQQSEQLLSVDNFFPYYEQMGIYQMIDKGNRVDIPCLRPWTVEPERIVPMGKQRILDTSKAQLIWHTQFVPKGDGLLLEIPHGSQWEDIIKEIRFHCHHFNSPLEVRRFSDRSKADLRIREDGITRSIEVSASFVLQDEIPVSLGFAQEVDGICIRFKIPDNFVISTSDPNQNKVRSFRSAFFRHCILTSKVLDGIANKFQRDWLYQLYMSAIVSKAILHQLSLQDAAQKIAHLNIAELMNEVMESIFQTLPGVEDEKDEADGEASLQKVHQQLLDLCSISEVTGELAKLSSVLWEEPGEEWNRWAEQRFRSTIGSALLQACLSLSADFGTSDLYLDLDPGPRPDGSPQCPEGLEEIWITESMSGGGGIIEEIMKRFAEDPRLFFRLLYSSLTPSDYEAVDSELTRLVKLLQSDTKLATCFINVRNARNYEAIRSANDKLRQSLLRRGFLLNHSIFNAINIRLLRSGSNPQTDLLHYDLISFLEKEETRLGVEIDARVLAYVCSQNNLFKKHVSNIDPGAGSDPTRCFQIIFSFLWPRGNIARSIGFSNYNPFVNIEDADRNILLDILNSDVEVISVHDSDWKDKVILAIQKTGSVRLYAELAKESELKSALLSLALEPMDIDYLHLYPLIESVVRESDGYYVDVDIREAVQ